MCVYIVYIYLNLFSSNGNDARVASNVTSAQKIFMLKYEILSSFFQFFVLVFIFCFFVSSSIYSVYSLLDYYLRYFVIFS